MSDDASDTAFEEVLNTLDISRTIDDLGAIAACPAGPYDAASYRRNF